MPIALQPIMPTGMQRLRGTPCQLSCNQSCQRACNVTSGNKTTTGAVRLKLDFLSTNSEKIPFPVIFDCSFSYRSSNFPVPSIFQYL